MKTASKKVVDSKALGMKVKQYREEKGLSAKRLADKANISLSHINNIESNSCSPSVDVLLRISHVLDVSLDMLLCDSLRGEAKRSARAEEYNQLLEDCTDAELQVIIATVRTLKKELRSR